MYNIFKIYEHKLPPSFLSPIGSHPPPQVTGSFYGRIELYFQKNLLNLVDYSYPDDQIWPVEMSEEEVTAATLLTSLKQKSLLFFRLPSAVSWSLFSPTEIFRNLYFKCVSWVIFVPNFQSHSLCLPPFLSHKSTDIHTSSLGRREWNITKNS